MFWKLGFLEINLKFLRGEKVKIVMIKMVITEIAF